MTTNPQKITFGEMRSSGVRASRASMLTWIKNALERQAMIVNFEKLHSFCCPDAVTSRTRTRRLDALYRPRIKRQALRFSAIIRP